MPSSAIIVDIRWRWWRSLSPRLNPNLNLNHSLSPNLNNQGLSILVSRLLEPLL